MESYEYKLLGDLSNLTHGGQEHAIDTYIHSLLFGDLKEHLSEKGVKVFKGISRDFTKKYIRKFNEVLKLNDYTRGPLDIAFTIDHEGEQSIEYFGFFVFQNSRGNVFGSFPEAYKFANDMYLFNKMIMGNATVVLAKNTDVKFGRAVIQSGDIKEQDLESVVNHDFYKSLVND
jgi:hypothetical protein